MREESNRVVQNMEKNRRAEMENRDRTLRAMKENEDYTRRAEERNFQIQQQNLKTQLVQSQLEADVIQQQGRIDAQAAEQVFGSLANFSGTAVKLGLQAEAKRRERKTAEEYVEAALGLNTEKSLGYKNAELALLEDGEKWNTAVNIQEAQGAEPNAVSKQRFGNPTNTFIANESNATWMLKNQFPIFLDALLNNTEKQFEFNGRLVTPSEARSDPQLMSTVNRAALNIFLKNRGLFGLNAEFLVDGLRAAETHMSSLVRGASATQTKTTYEMDKERLVATANNNPERFPERAQTVFRSLASNPLVGYSGALDIMQNLAAERSPDGSSFTHSMEALGNMVLKPDGKPFKEEWPNRWAAMNEARTNAEIKNARRQMQIEDIGFEQKSREVLQGLLEQPTQGNADAAVDFFMENYGKVPPEITKFSSSYTAEAREKLEAAKQYLAIPSGLITLEAVEGAEAIDHATGRQMRQRYAEQEARYNSGIFKDTSEAFKTTANGVTAYGTNKPNTAASVFLQSQMRSVYRKRVDQAVAGGMDFNQAATAVGQQLDAEVKAGARDPNSPWYRKTDAPGGTPTFPNLNKGMLSAVDEANRRFNDLKKNIATNGLEKTLNTKDSIITAEEAAQIAQSYGKPGFQIPADVRAVAGMSNGLDPMVIINSQLVAQGMQPLAPPPSLQSTSQLVSPEFQKLLYKNPSLNRSARGLGTSNVFNPAIVPNNYGPLIQQASQSSGVNPSFIAALAEIESGFNPGSTSYNGSSFGVMQINRDAHPAFFAQQNWKDPQANINYGTQYYAGLLNKYKDPVAAAMAYNAGPGNYDAYLTGQLPDGRVKTEMLNHGKKFARVMYKYGGSGTALTNPNLMRSGNSNMKLVASAASYVGMDTSDGPDEGKNACVWALNKVMRSAGMDVPWGNSVYVPFVKDVLDKTARRVSGPVPGAIAVMQDNHPTEPYPHIGIVGSNGMIISNSTSRSRFDWRGTPQEYEQKYGRPNLYYVLN